MDFFRRYKRLFINYERFLLLRTLSVTLSRGAEKKLFVNFWLGFTPTLKKKNFHQRGRFIENFQKVCAKIWISYGFLTDFLRILFGYETDLVPKVVFFCFFAKTKFTDRQTLF